MTGRRSSCWPATLIIGALAIGCTNWVTPPGSVEDLVQSHEVPRVRIQTAGETVVLQFPRIVGDSLAGSTTTPKGMRILDARVTYSLDEIEEAEIEEFDWAQTTLAIGTFLGAWFSLMLLAAKSS
jgi:hypothetical protein